MAKLRAAKGKPKKVGAAKKKTVKQTGSSNKVYDKRFQALKPGKRKTANPHKYRGKTIKKSTTYTENRENRSDKGKLLGIGNLFDISAISDIDSLKKQYYLLAKKYHPDAGGTTYQFQELQKNYEDLFKKLINGSALTQDQKSNEFILDEAMRSIINQLVVYPFITIDVVGKWIWVGGETYPIKSALKSSGLTFIKKGGTPYWVYKGVESSSYGKKSLEEIKQKYGSSRFDLKPQKSISGFNSFLFKTNIKKIKTAINRRPI